MGYEGPTDDIPHRLAGSAARRLGGSGTYVGAVERRLQRQRARRSKQLSGPARAGQWSRNRAREIRLGFIRQHWQVLAGLTVGAMALAPATLFLPEPHRWLMLGSFLTAVVAADLHLILIYSGAAYLDTAAQAEVWTQQQLAPIRRHGRGWEVIHRMLLRAGGDIDHVAIGPPGVFVIETKWSIARPGSRREEPWLREAARQAADGAKQTALVLRSKLGVIQVHPVVVVWPATDLVHREIDGVTLLPGDELREWLESRDERMTPAEVQTASSVLHAQLELRESYERRVNPPPPTTVAYAWQIGSYPVGAFIGLLVAATELELSRRLWLPTALTTASAAALLTRVPLIRGFGIASAAINAVAVAGSYLYVLVADTLA